MNRYLISGICLMVIAGSSTSGTRYQWAVEDGGNGHWYEPVAVDRHISWSYASNQAALAGGYLATITSSQECAFVWSLISTNTTLWSSDGGRHPGQKPGPFIGGYQKEGSDEPAGGWCWVTGEAFIYEGWNSDEPNNKNGGRENRIAYRWIDMNHPAGWNDVIDLCPDDVISFIIEYDSAMQNISLNKQVLGDAKGKNFVEGEETVRKD